MISNTANTYVLRQATLAKLAGEISDDQYAELCEDLVKEGAYGFMNGLRGLVRTGKQYFTPDGFRPGNTFRKQWQYNAGLYRRAGHIRNAMPGNAAGNAAGQAVGQPAAHAAGQAVGQPAAQPGFFARHPWATGAGLVGAGLAGGYMMSPSAQPMQQSMPMYPQQMMVR